MGQLHRLIYFSPQCDKKGVGIPILWLRKLGLRKVKYLGQSHPGLEPRTIGLQSPRLPVPKPILSPKPSRHLAACLSFLPPFSPLWAPGFLFLSSSRQLVMPFAPTALSKGRTIIPLQQCTGFPQAALWEQSCLPSPLWVKTLQDPMKGQKSGKVKRR